MIEDIYADKQFTTLSCPKPGVGKLRFASRHDFPCSPQKPEANNKEDFGH